MRPRKVVALLAADMLTYDLRAMQLSVWNYAVVPSESAMTAPPACFLLDGVVDSDQVRLLRRLRRRWGCKVPVLAVNCRSNTVGMLGAVATATLDWTMGEATVRERLSVLCARKRGPKSALGEDHSKAYVRQRTMRLRAGQVAA